MLVWSRHQHWSRRTSRALSRWKADLLFIVHFWHLPGTSRLYFPRKVLVCFAGFFSRILCMLNKAERCFCNCRMVTCRLFGKSNRSSFHIYWICMWTAFFMQIAFQLHCDYWFSALCFDSNLLSLYRCIDSSINVTFLRQWSYHFMSTHTYFWMDSSFFISALFDFL